MPDVRKNTSTNLRLVNKDILEYVTTLTPNGALEPIPAINLATIICSLVRANPHTTDQITKYIFDN
jgi:hypothetical protein